MEITFRFAVFLVMALLLWGVGYLGCLRRRSSLYSDMEFAEEFLDRLSTYGDSRGHDRVAYTYLIQNSVRMQSSMGQLGLMDYGSLFHGTRVRNIQIVTNLIPQIDSLFQEPFSSRLIAEHFSTLDTAIHRYLGVLRDQADRAVVGPLACVARGVRLLLYSPIWFLAEAGLIPKKFGRRIQQSGVMSLLGGVVTVIGFVASIIDVTLGWGAFWELIRKAIRIAT